jgi:hypothetical protein
MNKEQKNIFEGLDIDIDWYKYNAVIQEASIIKAKEEKYLQIKQRLSQFDEVVTLDEALQLAKQILPTAMEVSSFCVGNATCTVVKRSDMMRISLETEREFICYDFVQ